MKKTLYRVSKLCTELAELLEITIWVAGCILHVLNARHTNRRPLARSVGWDIDSGMHLPKTKDLLGTPGLEIELKALSVITLKDFCQITLKDFGVPIFSENFGLFLKFLEKN